MAGLAYHQLIINTSYGCYLISGNIETNNLKTAKKELQQGSENIFNIIIVSLLINVTNSIVYLFMIILY